MAKICYMSLVDTTQRPFNRLKISDQVKEYTWNGWHNKVWPGAHEVIITYCVSCFIFNRTQLNLRITLNIKINIIKVTMELNVFPKAMYDIFIIVSASYFKNKFIIDMIVQIQKRK